MSVSICRAKSSIKPRKKKKTLQQHMFQVYVRSKTAVMDSSVNTIETMWRWSLSRNQY